jgi:protein TonB
MSAITVNAFPPLHAFSSSRSWFMALIVLVHLGFFWGLTHGLTVSVFVPKGGSDLFVIPEPPTPPVHKEPIDIKPDTNRIFVPPTQVPTLTTEDPHVPLQTTGEPPVVPPTTTVIERGGEGPDIVTPRVDARYPFTEPEYPVSEIRQQHEGTVWLSVEVLPSGRVGGVRIDESSGYAKLDDSAAREARKWRMKPGMEGGVAKAMWLKVPVKFQLKN